MIINTEPKKCRTLTASARAIMPRNWSESLFWREFTLHIGIDVCECTKDVMDYITENKLSGHRRQDIAIIMDPESISLRSAIKLLIKRNVKFKRVYR